MKAYIRQFCTEFYNEKEKLADRHAMGMMKLKSASGSEEGRQRYLEMGLITERPEVLELLKDGYDAFVENACLRIWKEHQDDIELNLCPRCTRIARTPEARQCRFCGFDWH